jgi:hypothetical protein
MNSYQMVLHRPVETAPILGKLLDTLAHCVFRYRFPPAAHERRAMGRSTACPRVTSRLSDGRGSANKIEFLLSKRFRLSGRREVVGQTRAEGWSSGVVPSVNLPPTFSQPDFQIPQLRRFLDPRGSTFSFLEGASNSLPSARSNALRATVLSA